MNLVEGLTRQIERVTELREEAKRIQANPPGGMPVNMAFYIAGHAAVSTGDVLACKKAYEELEEID